MDRFIKKRSQKAGMPPGTLVHIGKRKAGETKITLFNYYEQSFEEKEIKDVSECLQFKDKPGVTWINVEGLHEVAVLERFGEIFSLSPLVLEDILNTDQRPKIEVWDNYIYIVMKMFSYNNEEDEINVEQISLVLGENFVISFQEGIEGDVFDLVRERIRNNKSRIRKMKADYLAYSLIDSIVDNYFIILERIGEQIEYLEEELVSNPTQETLSIIHSLKRELILLRKSVWPLREVIGALEREESLLVKETTKVYLRDVYDHTIQIIDTLETFRDIISGILDVYLSSISNKLNEVMKVLTIIATIFIPLTFIAGIYGMNFVYMPEIKWIYGYPVVLLLMLTVAVSMLIYFKKKKWL